MRKIISVFVLFAFLANGLIPQSWAQLASPVGGEVNLPKPGVMVHLSPEFTPALLKGIVIHPENAFKFDFIVYKGDKGFTEVQKKEEYTKLIKYFLASLAVPDEDQWVNLSPYEKNRIIKDDFGKTEMGRDLLAQDYLLKQITASLIYPQGKLGKKFWDEVYSRAYKQFGTINIPVNTFNKVWIVPDEADIYEKGNIAYLYKSHLKVMLEEDYLSLSRHSQHDKSHAIGSQVVREVVLPQLEKEVNEDKNFAPLRQVFSGMILAAWYKRALRESLLARIYANKAKLKGVDQNPKNNEAIYRQYLKAYKKGVFNYIKEDVDKYTNETIPRKYFSGGTSLLGIDGSLALTRHVQGDRSAAMATVVSLGTRRQFDFATVSMDPKDAAMGVKRKRIIPPGLPDQYKEGYGIRPVRMSPQERITSAKERLIEIRQKSSPSVPISEKYRVILKEIFVKLDEQLEKYKYPSDSKEFKEIEQILRDIEELQEQGTGHDTAMKANDNKMGRRDFLRIAGAGAIAAINPISAEGQRTKLHDVVHKLEEIGKIVIGKSDKEFVFSNGLEIHEGKKLYYKSKLVKVVFIRPLAGPGRHINFKLVPVPEHSAIIWVFTTEFLDEDLDHHSPEGLMTTKEYKTNQRINKLFSPDEAMTVHHEDARLAFENVFLGKPEVSYCKLLPEHSVEVRFTNGVGLSLEIGSAGWATRTRVNISYQGHAFNFYVFGAKIFNSSYVPGQGLIKDDQDLLREIYGHFGIRETMHKFYTALLGDVEVTSFNEHSHKIVFANGVTLTLVAQHSGDGLSTEAVLSGDGFELSAFLQLEEDQLLQYRPVVGQPLREEYQKNLHEMFDGLMSFTTSSSAMIHGITADKLDHLGGIDMNAAHLDLHIKRDGNGVPLPVSQQDLAQIHIDGLVPVILEIRPASASPILAQLTAS